MAGLVHDFDRSSEHPSFHRATAMKYQRVFFDFWWLAAIAKNWVVIVLTMALAWHLNQVFVYLLAVFVIGTRQHALAVLQHDGTHYLVSRSKRLNNLAMNLFAAWPLAFSASGYRRYHLEHHRSLGTDGDPELKTYGRFAKKWSPDANRLKLFVTDLLGFGAAELLVLWDDIMMSREAGSQGRLEVLGIILWPSAIGGLVVSGGNWALLGCAAALWYGSLFTAFFAVFRLRAYCEHVGSDWTHRMSKPRLWQRLLFLPENTWLHWEHHQWPGVPLRHLKALAPEPALKGAGNVNSTGAPTTAGLA
jgi:fatty acid desaturase